MMHEKAVPPLAAGGTAFVGNMQLLAVLVVLSVLVFGIGGVLGVLCVLVAGFVGTVGIIAVRVGLVVLVIHAVHLLRYCYSVRRDRNYTYRSSACRQQNKMKLF